MTMMYDNSSLQEFKNCQERYRLRYILGLKKREEGYESIDKVWGKAIHAGLERLYLHGQRNTTQAIEEFDRSLGETPFNEEKIKTKGNGRLLLEHYAKHYEEEDKRWEILEVEEPHTFQLNEYPFTVKKDMVIKLQGNIFAVEHKTTKKAMNWDYWARYEPNSQVTAQVYSTMLKYGQCSGVIVNALKVGFRQRMYKGEPAGFNCEFQRQVFNRNREQVEDWKNQTLAWLLQLESLHLLNYPNKSSWKKNEGLCFYCPYKEICNTLGDESVVESLYEKVNPWEYLETNK